MNILFYSNHCKHCHECITLMDHYNLLPAFDKVSVDKDPQTRKRDPLVAQYGIVSVPSIVLDDKVYSGTRVFQWIEKYSAQQGVDTRQLSKEPQQMSTAPIFEQKGLSGFDSDSFASIGSIGGSIGSIEPKSNEKFQVPGKLDPGKAKVADRSYEQMMKEREAVIVPTPESKRR